MIDINKFQTKVTEYNEDSRTYRITVKYGMSKLGNQEPYFSITASVDRKITNNRYTEDSGGCLHELIIEKLPELKPLIQFHLWSQSGVPMHYVANAIYWYKGWCGETDGMFPYDKLNKTEERDKSRSILCDHIFLQEDEKIPTPNEFTNDYVKQWLKDRLPRIQELFHSTMREFDIEYIGE